MAASKSMFVRHVHTGEIREVTPEQREEQDKNYWVRITGDNVKATAPETVETVETTVTPEGDAPDAGDGDKTASKATPPKK
jgi:hypothetical protein